MRIFIETNHIYLIPVTLLENVASECQTNLLLCWLQHNGEWKESAIDAVRVHNYGVITGFIQ